MSDPIYLDHNASTPVPPRVRDAALRALCEGFGNPSATHTYGRRARALVDQARAQVAALLGASPDEVLFTSGGTEANNLALRGTLDEDRAALAAARRAGRAAALVTSALEHPATLEPARRLEGDGVRVTRVAPGADGRVAPDEIAAAVAGAAGARVIVVSVLLAQNETGVLQPVREIAARARALGALVHTDAAQAVGKVRVDVGDLGVDLLSVAGHKLYAPKGIGALYLRRGVTLRPVLRGAGHERGLRPGTENVAGAAALGEACALAMESLDAEAARQARLRDALEARLRARGFVAHGAGAPRLPNTLNGRFPGVRGSALLARAAGEIAFSTGSACHEGEERPSAALLAMGIPAADALGAIRLSLGRGTTDDDVERAARALLEAADACRKA